MSLAKDDGFTLAETLIALMVVSLAMASILAAATLVTRFTQQASRQGASNREADAAVSQLSAALANYQPGLTVGTPTGISFACGAARTCRFAAPKGMTFTYASGGNAWSSWQEIPVQTSESSRLEALILNARSGRTIGTFRLEVEQSVNCQFDMISRKCRGEGPGS